MREFDGLYDLLYNEGDRLDSEMVRYKRSVLGRYTPQWIDIAVGDYALVICGMSVLMEDLPTNAQYRCLNWKLIQTTGLSFTDSYRKISFPFEDVETRELDFV